MTKIINNLQVTVRNIHIRYEDKLSVPGVSGFRFKAERGTNSKMYYISILSLLV